MTIAFFIFWIVFSIVIAVIANSRERSGAAWFFLSLLISPILTLILILTLPRPESTPAKRKSKLYDE